MKNRILSLLASIALLSLASCTDEVQELAGEQSQLLKQIVMTTQDFQPEADSRTVYQVADGAVKCTWAENDTVGVFPDKGGQVYFPMISGAGTKNASFDGEGWALKDGRTYGAYYPCIGQFYLDRNAVPVSYTGQKQMGNGSMAHLGDYDYMVATPTAPEFGSAQFMFKHLSALVQLKITVPQPTTFTSVKLVTDTKAFAVEGKVDIMAETPGITPVTSSKEFVLNLQDVATTKENEVVTFYFMLPPADLSEQTLKAVLVSDKGNVEIDLESKNFKAGTAYALSGEMESTVAGYKDGVVTILEAGTMKQLLGDNWLDITSLKVVGPINRDDEDCLQQMLGSSRFSKSKWGKLTSLDMSDVSIVDNFINGIWAFMFSDCANLQEIVLPNDVTEIGYRAFSNCSSLTSVSIGDSVTFISEYAFEGCSSLISVNIKDLSAWCNMYFYNIQSNPLHKGAKLYLNNNELTELVIPADIEWLSDYAFYGCKSIKKVTMYNGVIGYCAFFHCSSLTSVAMGNGVTSIGGSAFSGCSSLTSVAMGNGVTSIGSSAFSGCSLLASIDIPVSVTSIGSSAFSGCSSLLSVAIPDGVTLISNYVFEDCSSLSSVAMGNGVISIGTSSFDGCSSLLSIDIPDDVISIGNAAFSDCSSLSSVDIPSGVTSIGNSTFAHCKSLSSVTIGNSVTSIGYSVFFGCSSLTSIDIPAGVTSIGGSAFCNCYSLVSVNITDLSAWCNLTFEDSYSNPLYRGAKLYLNNNELTELVIPADIKRIKDYAFYGCKSIKKVTMDKGVTSIGIQSFRNCSSLTQVYCKGTTPPTINPSSTNSSFNESSDKRTLYVPKGYLSAYQSSDWASFFGTITEME